MTVRALIGGSVAGHPGASGLVMDGSRIVGIGSITAKDLPPGTRIHQLNGNHVHPSFYDAHVHPLSAELNEMGLKLGGMNGHHLLAAVAAADDEGWVVGHGWDPSELARDAPTLVQLDHAQPTRPTLLVSSDGHSAFANTLALERAGLLNPTDHAARFVERDAHGSPTGLIHEVAKARVRAMLPPPPPSALDSAFDSAQASMFAHGITGWLDALVGRDPQGSDIADAYRRADADGRLLARVRGALWWHRDQGTEQVDRITELRTHYTGSRFQATAVKMMVDGTVEGRTAALIDPYVGSQSRGASLIDPLLMKRAVSLLQEKDFDVHFHAIGDRAVREALDAVEGAVRAHGPAHHQIAHLQLVDEADVDRFASLGAIAVIQALWARKDPQMVQVSDPLIGTERSDAQYPFGSLHKAGALIAMGSDWPVTTARVWPAIATAVARSWREGPPLGTAQELDLAAAIAAYTQGSRLACRRPPASLKVGGDAELVVIDRDPRLAHRDGSLSEIQTVSTYINGECVFTMQII